MLWGKYALGRRRKFKKGEILQTVLKNWRDFAKNRGNFRRFCSEKKAILKVIGRIFWCKKKFMIFQKNFDKKLIENNVNIEYKLL